MKMRLPISKILVSGAVILNIYSCNGGDKKTATTKVDTTKPAAVVAAKEKEKEKTPAEKPAIINILDTISAKAIVVYMKDSAASYDRIAGKLGKIYGLKLGEVLKKNGCKMAGPPMAWYKTKKAPYFFEAGVAVNKKPAKLPAGVFVRELTTDSALVAHFYGPYNLLSQGYDALKDRMKDKNKSLRSDPFEIYVGDPMDKDGKLMDPYKVRTDIVFPFK
jgi:hypothetical protein